MRRLILCADDFGDTAGATEAILTLGREGRLNAAAVMVGGKETAAAAPELKRMSQLGIGLHLTLSGGDSLARSALAPSGTLPHIDRLTVAAFARRLPLHAVAAEIERQFDRFELLFGRAPDFVDAHQHSHMLPGIRSLVVDATARRAPEAWIRTCEERIRTILARGASRWLAIRSALLSSGLAAQATAAGLETNTSFAGLYNFRGDADYSSLFRRWLILPSSLHLVICHPATDPGGAAVGASRRRELAFLEAAPLDRMIAAAGLSWWRPGRGGADSPAASA